MCYVPYPFLVCREFWNDKGKRTPCEKCWPGLDNENVETFQIWSIAAGDPRGCVPEGVLAVAKAFDVSDPGEVLIKVLHLAAIVRAEDGRKPNISRNDQR